MDQHASDTSDQHASDTSDQHASDTSRKAGAEEPTTDWRQFVELFLSRETLLTAVLLGFLASRFWLLFSFAAVYSDLVLYGAYARLGVDCGETAYRDIKIEYPPLAWWLIAAPRWLAEERYAAPKLSHRMTLEYMAGYMKAFRNELFAADLVCFVLLFLIGRKLSPRAEWWLPGAYALLSAAQPHLIYNRLDVVLLAFILGCFYCWLESLDDRPGSEYWAWGSYFCVGLGASFKIVPILLSPFLLLGDVRHSGWRNTGMRLAALALGAAGPFLIQGFISGPDVFYPFQYHGERGIHIESVYGSVMLLARSLGIACEVTHSHGGFNLEGALAGPLKIVGIALVAGCGLGLFAWAVRRRDYDRRLALDAGCVGMVMAVVLGTVFSPQYLNWLVPTVLLTAVSRSPKGLGLWGCLLVVLALSVGISSWLYPNNYNGEDGLTGLAALPVAANEIRSACLVVATSILALCLCRPERRGGVGREPEHPHRRTPPYRVDSLNVDLLAGRQAPPID